MGMHINTITAKIEHLHDFVSKHKNQQIQNLKTTIKNDYEVPDGNVSVIIHDLNYNGHGKEISFTIILV